MKSINPSVTDVHVFEPDTYCAGFLDCIYGLRFVFVGGLICRAVLEQTEHNVDTFISLSSPQSGQFGGMKKCQDSSLLSHYTIRQNFDTTCYEEYPHIFDHPSSVFALQNGCMCSRPIAREVKGKCTQ